MEIRQHISKQQMGQRGSLIRNKTNYLELNENENTTYEYLQDTVTATLGGKFMALHAYIRKEERSKISNISFHLIKLEKEDQYKPTTSRRKKSNELNNNTGQENQELSLKKKKFKKWTNLYQDNQGKKREDRNY